MIKKALVTIGLTAFAWVMSVEFAYSASAGLRGGITNEFSALSANGGDNYVDLGSMDKNERARTATRRHHQGTKANQQPIAVSDGGRAYRVDDLVYRTWKFTPLAEVGDGGEAFKAFFGYIPTADEMNLLYRVVMAEAGNTEPDAGIAAVVDVIGNRCLSPQFPDTINGVLCQRYQFSTVLDGAIWRYEPTERVIEIVNREIVFGKTYTEPLYFTAGGYNEYCMPLWIIGNHYFGK